jgi:hypothetical protein
VGVVALVAILRHQDGWRPWIAAALSPIGLFGYWLWVGIRLDRLDGWFWVQQKGWGAHFDGAHETAGQVIRGISEPPQPAYLMTSVVVVVFGVLTVLLLTDRKNVLPIVAFSVAMFVIVVGTAGSYHSKGRLLIPAFSALVPVASGLAATRAVVTTTVLAGISLVSILYGTYLLTVWQLSP